jgi:hypothetical protein
MYTSDDDRVVFDALSCAAMKEPSEILVEAGYPGGIEAFAKAARRWIVDNCDSWAGLGKAEALSGADREFPGGLDEFVETTWVRPTPLVSQTGPGDNGELAVTVMQPEEA